MLYLGCGIPALLGMIAIIATIFDPVAILILVICSIIGAVLNWIISNNSKEEEKNNNAQKK